MHDTSDETRARKAAAGALTVAAGGIALQIAGGADYPPVPPGLIILLAAAGAIGFVRRRWALAVATIATIFISAGAAVAPNLREQLAAPQDVLVFVGSGIQAVALLAALICCCMGLRAGFGSSARSAARGES